MKNAIKKFAREVSAFSSKHGALMVAVFVLTVVVTPDSIWWIGAEDAPEEMI